MFESLNDDCQLLIIDYLDLEDQQALWIASEGRAPRLNGNVLYSWQHKFSFAVTQEVLGEHPECLEAFLGAISERVQELDLLGIKSSELLCWRKHKFPQMRSLTFSKEDDSLGADILELIVELFPGLTSINCIDIDAYNSSQLKILENLPYLRQLDLGDCYGSPDDPWIDVSKLEELEELTVPVNFLKKTNMLKSVLDLPKLRTLYFYPDEYSRNILIEIIDRRGTDIDELAFNDNIWYWDAITLHRAVNLRHLTVFEDDGLGPIMMSALLRGFRQLEHVDLVGFQLWRSEVELWKTISEIPSLNVLNISGMQLYMLFFEPTRRHMNDVLNKRNHQLKLKCYNTGEYKDVVARYFKHPNLVLDWTPSDHDTGKSYGFVKVVFSPRE